MEDTPNPVGRPTDYTKELSDIICERLAEGESMRSVSRDDAMPAMTSLFKWLRENEEFAKQYARAKQEAADIYAEEIIEIADDGTNDYIEKLNEKGEKTGGYQFNGEHVQRSKLRVDSRKWIASKLKPKKYGDKISQEITGKDGGPIETSELSDREKARRIAFALHKGARESEAEE